MAEASSSASSVASAPAASFPMMSMYDSTYYDVEDIAETFSVPKEVFHSMMSYEPVQIPKKGEQQVQKTKLHNALSTTGTFLNNSSIHDLPPATAADLD